MSNNRKRVVGGSLAATIMITAISYLGFQEKPNNSGFQSADFEKAMKEVGWHKYDSWCVYFCKLVWHEAISDDTVRNAAMRLISGNSQSTLASFKKDTSGMFVLSDSARTGYIVIWQNFKNGVGTWSGHAGIVIMSHPGYFETVEGNTNDAGGREGYIVAHKSRKYSWGVNNGLRLRKFIGVREKVRR